MVAQCGEPAGTGSCLQAAMQGKIPALSPSVRADVLLPTKFTGICKSKFCKEVFYLKFSYTPTPYSL